jgi:7,8-dihydropterin-6-yl-methyl-4-(beta-D-ribofuranosyl)aminobenzene 5'-phosphate synthase
MNVTCVVDDAVQLSSPFWGEHGVAFLIESEDARVLFDTGQSGEVLLHNLDQLGVDPMTIEAIAVSHSHYDHTGGLSALMDHVRPGTPLYANADLFRERFSRHSDTGDIESVGLLMSREELEAGFTLHLSATPQEMVPGVWTTGEITDRSEPEGRSAHHLMREGDDLVADAYRDDMAVVLEADGGAVLLCGCCHAGLLNTLAQARRVTERPVTAIAGGLHLTGTTEDDLQHIEDVLNRMDSLQHIYANHCTGEDAYIYLKQALGPHLVHTCPVGTMLEF